MQLELNRIQKETSDKIKTFEGRISRCETMNADHAALAERLKKIEETLPKIVEGATAPDLESPTYKQILTELIQKTVNQNNSEKLVTFQDEDEKETNRRKKNNLVLINVPEPKATKTENRIKEDREMFFTLYDIEEGSFQEKTIQNMFRIGRKEDEKIRPLVVKFLDEETKTKYLKESRDPAFEVDGEEERIYVSQDMTKNQIQETGR